MILKNYTQIIILAVITTLLAGCDNFGQKTDSPNILIITMDTTRADRLSCYGHEQAMTPNLDSLAQQGVLYEQAFTNVPLTLPSHISIFTGTFPPANNIRVNAGGILSPNIPTLAELLQSDGYKTGAFISAWVLDSQFGLARGFDHYDQSFNNYADTSRGATERAGNKVCDSAINWMNKTDNEPFFAWVHFFDPHHPYNPPKKYKDLLEDNYDGEIAFMDEQIGRLLTLLDEKGIRDNTLIVVVGDHGESFEEHNETQHGLFIYNPTMQIPLIMSMPNQLPVNKRASQLVQHVDIMPTVLELANCDIPETVNGKSLINSSLDSPIYGESIYANQSFGWAPLSYIITSDWKYIHAPQPELYNRHTDPGELNNVIDSNSETASKMQNDLEQMVGNMISISADNAELDAEAIRRLESLGYVTSSSSNKSSADLGRDPKDMALIFFAMMKAKARNNSGRYGESISILEPLVASSPESPELHACLGEAYLRAKRYADAERELEDSIYYLPDDAVRLVALGDAKTAQGKLAEATSTYQHALDISPNFGQAWSRLGKLFAQKGNKNKALEYFNKCVELNPDSANAQTNLANLLFETGDIFQAINHYQAALQIDTAYLPAHTNLWQALLKTGKRDEAISALQDALTVAPDNNNFITALEKLVQK